VEKRGKKTPKKGGEKQLFPSRKYSGRVQALKQTARPKASAGAAAPGTAAIAIADAVTGQRPSTAIFPLRLQRILAKILGRNETGTSRNAPKLGFFLIGFMRFIDRRKGAGAAGERENPAKKIWF